RKGITEGIDRISSVRSGIGLRRYHHNRACPRHKSCCRRGKPRNRGAWTVPVKSHRIRLIQPPGSLLPDHSSSLSAVRPEQDLLTWRDAALRLETEVNGVVLGQAAPIRLLVIAVFSRGHVLLEGDVGVGKTTLLRSVARVIGGGYARIEGTIDLMPADLIYYTYVDELGKPKVAPGPLLKHGESLSTFFFNEVNRARPQMHSLLLRVMAERSVTAFDREYRFPHLQVFADRNRVEREETFEIPAAARDRFLMEIEIQAPSDPEMQLALMVETRFHNVDTLLERLPEGMVPFDQLNEVAELVQNHGKTSAVLLQFAWDYCRDAHDTRANVDCVYEVA